MILLYHKNLRILPINDGFFKDGQVHGVGIYKDLDGSVYKGEWHFGKKHRIGTEIQENGDKYEFIWEYGKCISKIKIIH